MSEENICFQETGGLNLITRKINTNDALDQEQQISIHTCRLYGWSHERCWEDRQRGSQLEEWVTMSISFVANQPTPSNVPPAETRPYV